MKRRFALLMAVLAVLMLIPVIALAAESDEPDTTLSSISITAQPSKTVYYVGEKFNPNGIKFKATYSSGHTYEHSYGANCTNSHQDLAFTEADGTAAASNGNDFDVTVYYTRGTKTVSATVTIKLYTKTLSSIAVATKPAKINYYVGESFSKKGLIVTATFESGSTQTLTSDQVSVESRTYSADDIGKTIPLTISYTYNKKTCTTTVDTGCYDLDSIKYDSGLSKTTYFVGERFDPAGAKFEATFKIGSETDTKKLSASEMTIYPKTFAKSDAGADVTIDAQYTYGYTTKSTGTDSMKVDVYGLDSIAISGSYKTVYEVGDGFDPTGLIVTATYKAGTSKSLTKTVYGFTYSQSPLTLSDNNTPMTIHYMEGDVDKTATTSNLTVTAKASQVIYLDKGSLNMVASEIAKINATVYPSTATDQEVKWTVSSGSCITVDSNGVVSAITKGSAIVMAYQGPKATPTVAAYCYVNVEPNVPIKTLKFTKSSLELLLNESTKLGLTVSPADATSAMTWSSSDKDVVSVTSDGVIKGLKTGSATITVTSSGLTAHLPVTVVSKLSRIGTVVNCQRRVNVRAKANGASQQIGFAHLGAKYRIIGESGDWYQIQYTSSKVGYIWKTYLSTKSGDKDYEPIETATTTTTTTTPSTSGASSATTASTVTIYNCNRYVYVRKGPSTAYSKLGHATLGSTYALKGASGDWYVVDYSGQTGYIYKDFCKLG